MAQQLKQRLFQRWIAIRRPKIQNFRGFAPQHGIHAGLQFLDGKEFLCRAGHHKRESIFGYVCSEPTKHLFPAFIGEEQFPPDSPVSIQDRRRRRCDLKSVAVSLDKRTASHVPLNQPFRFQLGVGIRHRRAVNAEHGRKFTAGRNAVAGAQIARVNEGAQLIAKLDVQRNVTLWLEMKWKHCLSPSANSTRYWPAHRHNPSRKGLGPNWPYTSKLGKIASPCFSPYQQENKNQRRQQDHPGGHQRVGRGA